MSAPPGMKLRLLLNAWQALARKIDPKRSRLSMGTRLSYWKNGVSHSMLNQIQQKSHEAAIKAAHVQPPIFVLGFWRSGTTLLHELLACDPQFGFPSTYACLNPSHFLLSESFIRKHEHPDSRRPMDDMRYSWTSPQEDEFALLALGAPSPYEALLVPSLARDLNTLLDLRTRSGEDQARWVDALQSFLKLLTVQQGKALILKSPTHGFRLPTLHKLFPQARYVIIERNPYEVFASNLKLWRTLLERYSLESPLEGEIEALVLGAYAMHEKIVAEATPDLDPRFVTVVRYEKLSANPLEEVERVYRELRLGELESGRVQREGYVKRVAGHNRNRFELSAAQKARVEQAWGTLIQQKGYEWPGDYINLR
jgi:omega-hydroxy-beta-dihydromenaquinone-9 sulfotransferase